MTRVAPILMSGANPRLIRETHKVQTRRKAWRDCKACEGMGRKVAPRLQGESPHCATCHGAGVLPTAWQSLRPGDVLYVRETFARPYRATASNTGCVFISDGPSFHLAGSLCRHQWRAGDSKWTPGIHMPRVLSRSTLIVRKVVPVESCQLISAEDALDEGVRPMVHRGVSGYGIEHPKPDQPPIIADSPVLVYRRLWDALHGGKPGDRFEDGVEVTAITFEFVDRNVDAYLKETAP